MPPAWGRCDYLAVTVWADVEAVKGVLDGGVVDRRWGGDFVGWIDRGPAKRVSATWEAAGRVRVLDYRGCGGYVSVELKGQACAELGNDGVRQLLRDLGRAFERVRASRFDVAYDGVPFDVLTVRDAAMAGQLNSRVVAPCTVEFRENAKGRTVYLSPIKGERCVRVYDYRGPVRFELQLRKAWAETAVRELLRDDDEAWQRTAMALVRDYVDFVDVAANEQACRCPLLPWWAGWVEASDRRRFKRAEVPAGDASVLPVGRADGLIQQYGRSLRAGVLAYGAEWLLARIERHGRKRWTAADDARVLELKRYLGSGLCGVPERPVVAGASELPF